jgi:hypothetical protein
MRRKLILTIGVCFSLVIVNAQLANTKWTGTANLLQEDKSIVHAKITMIFSKDSLNVLFEEGSVPEVLTYRATEDVMSLVKVSGGSPCEIGTSVKQKYQIKGNILHISVGQSKCEAYVNALVGSSFEKVE